MPVSPPASPPPEHLDIGQSDNTCSSSVPASLADSEDSPALAEEYEEAKDNVEFPLTQIDRRSIGIMEIYHDLLGRCAEAAKRVGKRHSALMTITNKIGEQKTNFEVKTKILLNAVSIAPFQEKRDTFMLFLQVMGMLDHIHLQLNTAEKHLKRILSKSEVIKSFSCLLESL